MKKLFVTLALCALCAPAAAQEPTTLKLGSLVPRESPWGQVLRVWVRAVKEKTGGAVQIDIFWNATQGDEAAQVGKLKAGQLDGAIVTAVGLGAIDYNVNALQMPGVFSGWEKVDQVREAVWPRFERSFTAAGLVLLGWGDLGLDRLWSKGFPIRGPEDLKGKRPWVWREDPIAPALFQAASQVVLVPTSLPEGLSELSTGNANVVDMAALPLEQVQWSSRLDHLNTMVVAPNIGAIILSKARLDTLKPEHRQTVLDTGRITCKALTEKIRGEDSQALERLKKRMTVVDPTEAERAAWQKVFREARARLAKGTFPPDLVKQIEDLAAK
jgi:TRAP-type C4-dicarboxylate transport system substrate-binding protein